MLPRPKDPTVPETTVTQLSDCLQQGASRLTDTHYAILFNVNVNERGEVSMVKIKDSMIGDREIESCMVRALEVMSLPSSITAMRSLQPVSRRMPAESRAPMGTVMVFGAGVSLIPITIVAAGVTIIVGITLYGVLSGVDMIAEAIKRRECPPCKLIDGTVVPVGTIAYRPMDTPSPGKVEHGILGPHYNLYKANQNPNNCQCFWQPIGAVPPPPQPGWIPIQAFAN
jgi:hypothetical protein